MYLVAHPLCADPGNVHGSEVVTANEVDHIKSKSQGGKDEWDNLQALCKSCHSRKTAAEDDGYGK
jgi:5-methylcytosine-specific restriction protein A